MRGQPRRRGELGHVPRPEFVRREQRGELRSSLRTQEPVDREARGRLESGEGLPKGRLGTVDDLDAVAERPEAPQRLRVLRDAFERVGREEPGRDGGELRLGHGSHLFS
jgi:hypothetical protein